MIPSGFNCFRALDRHAPGDRVAILTWIPVGFLNVGSAVRVHLVGGLQFGFGKRPASGEFHQRSETPLLTSIGGLAFRVDRGLDRDNVLGTLEENSAQAVHADHDDSGVPTLVDEQSLGVGGIESTEVFRTGYRRPLTLEHTAGRRVRPGRATVRTRRLQLEVDCV